MTRHDHDDPAALTEPELVRLLWDAHDDLLRYTRAHTDPAARLLAFMDENASPSRPQPVHPSDDLRILELRNLTHRVQRRLPEGFPELRDALLRADLPDPNLKHLSYLMTLTQALITVSDRYPQTARDLALDLARDLDAAGAAARDLGLTTDYGSACAIAWDLARDPASARAVGKVFALYRALDRALCHAIDPARGPAHCAREVVGVIATDLDHRFVWSSKSVFVLVRAVASALEAEPVNLSGVDVSQLRDLDLEALAGAVWNRDTTWPVHMRELIERHSEEIGDGVFRVRGGTELDPQGSVLV
ncbi:hypothetical protein OHR68_31810 [Spirillospora sp. NBC_00431]